MALPPDKLQRLATLVGMLGSDHDGEKLAVIRAIGKLLNNNQMNFTDLGLLLISRRAPDPVPHTDMWSPRSRRVVEIMDLFPIAGGTVDALVIHDTVRLIVENSTLGSWELDFLESINDRAATRRVMKLSPKQCRVFRNLIGRLRI
jgi:hypothetical protein